MEEEKTKLRKLLEKQQYQYTGNHSAVKVCTWTKKGLKNEGQCYKGKFYGLSSHLCTQMTPSVDVCQNKCVFCWRESDYFGLSRDGEMDDPKEIVENSILAQRKLLSGFGGNDKVDKEKLAAAQHPKHFAISLTGEPTMYPKLSEMIRETHKKGITTFVVSNGMLPSKLKTLEPPTQLYVSVDAPNKELFIDIDKPELKDGWERLMQTLDVLKELKGKTRTVLRFTLIKGLNMTDVGGWAATITRSDAMFVEIKAYMFVGGSRHRLSIENMPRHPEVKEFAQKIADACGYKIIDEQESSRVVLLAKEDTPDRFLKLD